MNKNVSLAILTAVIVAALALCVGSFYLDDHADPSVDEKQKEYCETAGNIVDLTIALDLGSGYESADGVDTVYIDGDVIDPSLWISDSESLTIRAEAMFGYEVGDHMISIAFDGRNSVECDVPLTIYAMTAEGLMGDWTNTYSHIVSYDEGNYNSDFYDISIDYASNGMISITGEYLNGFFFYDGEYIYGNCDGWCVYGMLINSYTLFMMMLCGGEGSNWAWTSIYTKEGNVNISNIEMNEVDERRFFISSGTLYSDMQVQDLITDERVQYLMMAEDEGTGMAAAYLTQVIDGELTNTWLACCILPMDFDMFGCDVLGVDEGGHIWQISFESDTATAVTSMRSDSGTYSDAQCGIIREYNSDGTQFAEAFDGNRLKGTEWISSYSTTYGESGFTGESAFSSIVIDSEYANIIGGTITLSGEEYAFSAVTDSYLTTYYNGIAVGEDGSFTFSILIGEGVKMALCIDWNDSIERIVLEMINDTSGTWHLSCMYWAEDDVLQYAEGGETEFVIGWKSNTGVFSGTYGEYPVTGYISGEYLNMDMSMSDADATAFGWFDGDVLYMNVVKEHQGSNESYLLIFTRDGTLPDPVSQPPDVKGTYGLTSGYSLINGVGTDLAAIGTQDIEVCDQLGWIFTGTMDQYEGDVLTECKITGIILPDSIRGYSSLVITDNIGGVWTGKYDDGTMVLRTAMQYTDSEGEQQSASGIRTYGGTIDDEYVDLEGMSWHADMGFMVNRSGSLELIMTEQLLVISHQEGWLLSGYIVEDGVPYMLSGIIDFCEYDNAYTLDCVVVIDGEAISMSVYLTEDLNVVRLVNFVNTEDAVGTALFDMKWQDPRTIDVTGEWGLSGEGFFFPIIKIDRVEGHSITGSILGEQFIGTSINGDIKFYLNDQGNDYCQAFVINADTLFFIMFATTDGQAHTINFNLTKSGVIVEYDPVDIEGMIWNLYDGNTVNTQKVNNLKTYGDQILTIGEQSGNTFEGTMTQVIGDNDLVEVRVFGIIAPYQCGKYYYSVTMIDEYGTIWSGQISEDLESVRLSTFMMSDLESTGTGLTISNRMYVLPNSSSIMYYVVLDNAVAKAVSGTITYDDGHTEEITDLDYQIDFNAYCHVTDMYVAEYSNGDENSILYIYQYNGANSFRSICFTGVNAYDDGNSLVTGWFSYDATSMYLMESFPDEGYTVFLEFELIRA